MNLTTKNDPQRRKRIAAGVASGVGTLLLIAAIVGAIAGVIAILNTPLYDAHMWVKRNIRFSSITDPSTGKPWEGGLTFLNPEANDPKIGGQIKLGRALTKYLEQQARLNLIQVMARQMIDQALGPQAGVILRVAMFVFFILVFMTFFRIFTFMGYFRSVRAAVFCAAVLYALLPNPTGELWDEILFLAIAVALILIRATWVQQKRRRKKSKGEPPPEDSKTPAPPETPGPPGPLGPPGPATSHGPEADILFKPREESS
jgi:hypothetical protein